MDTFIQIAQGTIILASIIGITILIIKLPTSPKSNTNNPNPNTYTKPPKERE